MYLKIKYQCSTLIRLASFQNVTNKMIKYHSFLQFAFYIVSRISFSYISNFCARKSNLKIRISMTGKVLTSKNRAMHFFITNVLLIITYIQYYISILNIDLFNHHLSIQFPQQPLKNNEQHDQNFVRLWTEKVQKSKHNGFTPFFVAILH